MHIFYVLFVHVDMDMHMSMWCVSGLDKACGQQMKPIDIKVRACMVVDKTEKRMRAAACLLYTSPSPRD